MAGDCDNDARTLSAPQPHHFILNCRSAVSKCVSELPIVTPTDFFAFNEILTGDARFVRLLTPPLRCYKDLVQAPIV